MGESLQDQLRVILPDLNTNKYLYRSRYRYLLSWLSWLCWFGWVTSAKILATATLARLVQDTSAVLSSSVNHYRPVSLSGSTPLHTLWYVCVYLLLCLLCVICLLVVYLEYNNTDLFICRPNKTNTTTTKKGDRHTTPHKHVTILFGSVLGYHWKCYCYRWYITTLNHTNQHNQHLIHPTSTSTSAH